MVLYLNPSLVGNFNIFLSPFLPKKKEAMQNERKYESHIDTVGNIGTTSVKFVVLSKTSEEGVSKQRAEIHKDCFP